MPGIFLPLLGTGLVPVCLGKHSGLLLEIGNFFVKCDGSFDLFMLIKLLIPVNLTYIKVD